MSRDTSTRGLRNNNPGNIRAVSSTTWRGQTGIDDAGFVIFDNASNGLRALARTLNTYYYDRGINTIGGIINRYAPNTENDTTSYIMAVAADVEIPAYHSIPRDMWIKVRPHIIAAIIKHENGKQPFSVAQINRGIELAA